MSEVDLRNLKRLGTDYIDLYIILFIVGITIPIEERQWKHYMTL